MGKIIITTDGSSVSANNEKGFDAASAFAIYRNNTIIYKESKLLLNHTNNYAEMYAIYKSTKYLIDQSINLSDIDSILIITDSQLCEKSLNEWMQGWLRKTDNEILMSTTGRVKNQELVKSAYINILLLSLSIPVYICHINSHNSENKIPEMYKKFISKYFEINMDEFKLIFEGNKIVDKLAYDTLNEK